MTNNFCGENNGRNLFIQRQKKKTHFNTKSGYFIIIKIIVDIFELKFSRKDLLLIRILSEMCLKCIVIGSVTPFVIIFQNINIFLFRRSTGAPLLLIPLRFMQSKVCLLEISLKSFH